MQKEKLFGLLEEYKDKVLQRRETHDLAPRPLTSKEVEGIIQGLTISGLEEETFTVFESEQVDELLLRLLAEEVRRGTFPSSYSKAEGLAEFVTGELESEYLSAEEALDLLAEMKGGAASKELIDLLAEGYYEDEIIEILKDTVLVNKDEFDQLTEIAKDKSKVETVIKHWANRGFAQDWELESTQQGLAITVGDNLTTGHLSPSKRADTRTDHPLHAKYIMEGRADEADFLDRLAKLKEKTDDIFL
jgi:aconitate hydratase 2/2-methylisocitrate dehydratase